MVVWSGGCLSDESLGLQCENNSDCPSGYCTYAVCVFPVVVDTGSDSEADLPVSLACDPGLTPCGDVCVDLRRSGDHCGACDELCVAGPREEAVCLGGDCVRECVFGWVDLDGAEFPGCDYECIATTGVRDDFCDGIDNDCDGLTDDADSDATSPACAEQAGVCRGTRQPCVTGLPRGCTAQDYAAQTTDLYQVGEELHCDGVDNNCDGRVDEHCCVGTDDRFEVFGAGERWVAAGFKWRGAELELVAYGGGRISTVSVGRFGGLNEIAGWDFADCAFDEFHVANEVDDTIYVSCGAEPSGVASDGRFEMIAETTAPESVRINGGGQDGVEMVLVTYAEAAGRATTLARDDGSLTVAPFTPPTAHEGPAIARVSTGGVVSFAVPDGEVRLQEVDEDLAAVGFGLTIATPAWTAESLLETGIVAGADDSVLVVWADPEGGVSTSTWEVDAEAPSRGPTLGSDLVLRLDASRSPAGVLVNAVTTEGVEVWLLAPSGEVVNSWSHVLDEVTRETTLGEQPVRIVSETDGKQLWLAFGAPADAAAPSEGLFVIRLGTNSEALCE